MPQANIVSAWTDGGLASMEVTVAETDGKNHVYTGSVDNNATFQALTNAQKKTALLNAVKAVRDAQVTQRTSIGGITGTAAV